MTAHLFMPSGEVDRLGVFWYLSSRQEVAPLLARAHYLGPLGAGSDRVVIAGEKDGRLVACSVWKNPTARMLPNDGRWFELARWCLTPAAGSNAGSRMHRYSLPFLRRAGALTLLSYSDPSVGHTGALYRAANWIWAPQWQRLRPPPTRGGTWDGITVQEPKDRWVFHVTRRDPRRQQLVCDDRGAVRYWLAHATAEERAWARLSPYMHAAMSGGAA